MGVHKLWEILEPAKQIIPLDALEGQGLCIDLSYWIIQLNKVNGGGVKDKPHLRGLFHRFRALLALNCHLVLVTDGAVPAVKAGVYVKRLFKAQPLRPHRQNHPAGIPLKRNKGSEFGRMVEDAKALAAAFGIPCVGSLEEAEAQCAALNAMGFADACFTADSDALLFGANVVYKDISLKPGDSHVVAYDMTKIQAAFGYGRNSLIALGIMLGCDYFPGVHGIGPERAQQIVKKFGEEKILDMMLREGPVTLARRALKGVDKENWALPAAHDFPEEDKLARAAVLAYTHPKCHARTSEAAQRSLLGGPLQMDIITKICAQEFEWSSETTCDYVLPKLAERDVRRMASMQLANEVNERAIQYKVSEIVKKRQLRGVEHYEVKWVGDPKISSSTVPAECVQRAYPSKVAEFTCKLASRGKARRPNGSSSSSDLCASMARLSVVSRPVTTASEIPVEKAKAPPEVEVIDLTTPLAKHSSYITTTILSDDEDAQHQHRVRQLKSFIASIK